MGLYILAAAELFERVRTEHPELTVWVSFFEIYGGKLFDLLNDRKPVLAREDAKKVINIVGLIEHGPLPDVQSLMDIIEYGNNNRKTGVLDVLILPMFLALPSLLCPAVCH